MSKESRWTCDSCNAVNYGSLCSHCSNGWICKNCLTVNTAFDMYDNICFKCNTMSQARKNKLKNSSWKCDRCDNDNYSHSMLCTSCEDCWRCEKCYEINRYLSIDVCSKCNTRSQARKNKLKNSSWKCELCDKDNYSHSILCTNCEHCWRCEKCYETNLRLTETCPNCNKRSQETRKKIAENEKLQKAVEKIQKETNNPQSSFNNRQNKTTQETTDTSNILPSAKTTENILHYVLDGNGKTSLELLKKSDWGFLKDHSNFEKPKPTLKQIQPPTKIAPKHSLDELLEPIPLSPKKATLYKTNPPVKPSIIYSYNIKVDRPIGYTISSEPKESEHIYKPDLDLWDKIFFWMASRKTKEAKDLFISHCQAYTKRKEEIEREYQNDLQKYEEQVKQHQENIIYYENLFKYEEQQNFIEYQKEIKEIEERNEQNRRTFKENEQTFEETFRQEQELYRQRVAREQQMYEENLTNWEKEQENFYQEREKTNNAIEIKKQQYTQHIPEAVSFYFNEILKHSIYPKTFPKIHQLEYNSETKTIVINYSLPSIKNISRVKETKYIKTRNEYNDILFSESELNKIYDNLLYQITLRTVHELYYLDYSEALHYIVFNGWVESINTATGTEENACVLSLQAGRDEFLLINLANVDPKTCFKALKGIGSSKLHNLTPIAPLLTISREDNRFIPSYNVAHNLDNNYNLAAMDWEDFEHLIRELFEKEFSQVGGEVKVTQASRDGGVDAIAFDPDPIRGGKIVIQAKRYTNIVSVSAVRDLYGTIMNEGATKGILVTTADFGPDSYDFAKGKPITLLNGGNLLHLLEKHGHKAKIDLKEARKILVEKEQEQKSHKN